jgi:hypothetical protein
VQHLCAPSPSISERGIAGCESCVYCVRPPAVSRSSAALPLSLFSLSLGSPSPSLRILYMVSLSLNVPFSLSLTHTLCSPSLPLCHLSLPHSVLAARCTASAFRTRRGPRPALSLSLSLSLFSLSALSALSLPHSVLAARRTLFASRRPPGPRPALSLSLSLSVLPLCSLCSLSPAFCVGCSTHLVCIPEATGSAPSASDCADGGGADAMAATCPPKGFVNKSKQSC